MPLRPSRLLLLSTLLPPALAAQGLDGTAWVAERVVARAAVGPRGLPTLRFEKGRIAGFDGCNRLTGPVTFSGADGIAVGRLAGTMMACPPGELADQAGAIRDGLARAARAVVQGDRLVLYAADGKEIAQFRRQSTSIADVPWEVTMINNGKGAVASTIANPGVPVVIAFRGNGRGGGTGGCNQLSFAWTQQGEAVTISNVAATRKLCPAPKGLMEQEAALAAALAKATVPRIEGDRLELRDAGGALQVSARRTTPPAGGAGSAAPARGDDGMGGEFTYLADAARFTDCRTGQAWPVAMEGAWIDVERAYLAAKRQGKPLYAVIDGAIAQRPRMEGSGTEGTLVVSRLVGAFPLMRCERAKGTASMTNTYWRLVKLGDEAIVTTNGRREASVTIRGTNPAEMRFSATVGCNQLGGRAVVTGNNVAFTPGPSTLMACPEPLGFRERRLVEALGAARSFRIIAETMELRDASGRGVALFEAVYM